MLEYLIKLNKDFHNDEGSLEISDIKYIVKNLMDKYKKEIVEI